MKIYGFTVGHLIETLQYIENKNLPIVDNKGRPITSCSDNGNSIQLQYLNVKAGPAKGSK
jgi:hypothetical protein